MDEREQTLAEAQKRLSGRDWDGASELLSHRIAHAPDDARAHALLGMAKAGSLDYDAAVVHLWRAIEIDSTQPAYHYNLGCALEAIGDTAAALAEYGSAAALAPGYQRARDAVTRLRPEGTPEPIPPSAPAPAGLPEPPVIPPFQPSYVAGNAPPRTAPTTRLNAPPDLVQDLGGLRRADDPPDLVRWLGIGYLLIAVVTAFTLLNILLTMAAVMHNGGGPGMLNLVFQFIGTVIGAGICFLMYRGFVEGLRIAWYAQIAIAILALLCLPLALVAYYFLLIPAAGAGILYHWRSPAIREWFGLR